MADSVTASDIKIETAVDNLNVNSTTSQGKESTNDEVEICTMDMFMCADGSDCLPAIVVCDGIQNCFDNSDELNCSKAVKGKMNNLF